MARDFDVDWLVVGSGFGGSVAALRLAEKGYSVLVLEQGRQWNDADFAESAWQNAKVQWMPWLGMRGILRITPFRHVNALTGVGVGGGSLVWANTSYVPHSDDFYRHPQWADLEDWRRALEPHYRTAQSMLGVVEPSFDGPSERLMRRLAEDMGVPETFRTPPVAVFLGEAGVEVADPYFGGEGPRRTGCTRCGQCLIGCRAGAKNTLVKNYLWLAARRGTRIRAERRVVDVRPADGGDGSAGWIVEHTATPPAWGASRETLRARGVVVAGGALGTNDLLLRCRRRGSLARLSPRLGELARTNSEAITAATAAARDADYRTAIAITASIFPDAHTHITNNTYGGAGDANSLLFLPHTGAGSRGQRIRRLLATILRQPAAAWRVLDPRGWSRRSIVFTTMQSIDSSLRLALRPRRLGRGVVMDTAQGEGALPAGFVDAAARAVELAARHMDGDAQNFALDVLRGVPTTAHFLGGAVIGRDSSRGVVDAGLRAFGYENLMICDGSVLPANPGVNPSLSILAVAEYAMARLPARSESARRV